MAVNFKEYLFIYLFYIKINKNNHPVRFILAPRLYLLFYHEVGRI